MDVGSHPTRSRSLYTTSKHAVVGLSKAQRAEARGRGVRVSVACPGMIQTPIWERSEVRGSLARGRDALLSRLPANTSAEQCAKTILRGVAANRGVILVTAEAHAAWSLSRISPSATEWLSHQLASLARRTAR